MRIGVMIGPERGEPARKIKRLIDEAEWAEAAGIPTAWIPQIPDDMDALQMVSLLGTAPGGSSSAPRSCRCRPSTRWPSPGRR